MLFFATKITFGQMMWWLNFDSPGPFDNQLMVDTVTNPNCLWQIGQPSKTVFSSASSLPKAIVTDTLNPVPANDTSIFYLYHTTSPISWHMFELHFKYQMHGDLTDKGIVEVSPDSGQTWINVLTQDSSYNFSWIGPEPTLAGSTNGWQFFDLYLMSGTQTMGSLSLSDTIMFRFTYITDSNTTIKDGWMIDDFNIGDWIEGVGEFESDNIFSVYPNPAIDEINLLLKNCKSGGMIQIFSSTGQLIYEEKPFNGNKISTKKFSNGIYVLKYSDGINYSARTFVVNQS